MKDLRELAITAHGGLTRWNQLQNVTAHTLTGGALWGIKGQDGVISDSTVHVDLHRQFTSHSPFGGPGLRDAYTPDRVAVENDSGAVIAERIQPRSAFAGHSLETAWDRLHLAYFTGYAMWTYLDPALFLGRARCRPWNSRPGRRTVRPGAASKSISLT